LCAKTLRIGAAGKQFSAVYKQEHKFLPSEIWTLFRKTASEEFERREGVK